MYVKRGNIFGEEKKEEIKLFKEVPLKKKRSKSLSGEPEQFTEMDYVDLDEVPGKFIL
jgi:hypothetical protein